jgi:UDP-N-acetylglucosamine acyltransferase
MSHQIHPTAVVHKQAELGAGVVVGPYAVIGPDVTIGARTQIGPQVVIDGHTTLGEDNLIVGQANIGAAPQDLSYRGEDTLCAIGDRNTIREFVTINRGTVKGGGVTRIGSQNLLMACSHVAHDCEIEDKVILANTVLLAGHVRVCEGASVSGASVAHHFVTIGRYAYVGGMTRMAQDVPPFMLVEGHPARIRRVNVIGLRRAGFEEPEIESLQRAFRRIWRSGESRRAILDELERDPEATGVVLQLVQALKQTGVGLKGRFRESLRGDFTDRGLELFPEARHG